MEPELIAQLERLGEAVCREVLPRAAVRRFAIGPCGEFVGAAFTPRGDDVRALLAPCREAALMAVTLGVQSERMLLREQARDAGQALLLDAALSAATEAACDALERCLRTQLSGQGRCLTERFSPGYGDMPLEQSREICAVLGTDTAIGLTVSDSGILIPRKSVTAVLGVGDAPPARRHSACESCAACGTCAMRRENQ